MMRSKLLAAQALHPALVLPDGRYRVRLVSRKKKMCKPPRIDRGYG